MHNLCGLALSASQHNTLGPNVCNLDLGQVTSPFRVFISTCNEDFFLNFLFFLKNFYFYFILLFF